MRDYLAKRKKEINVLFYAPKAPPIGGIASWYECIENGNHEGYRYFLVNSSVNGKRQNSSRIIKPFLLLFTFFKQFSRLKSTIKKNNIDVLHVCSSGGKGFLRDYLFLKYAKKRKIKTIIHLHFGRVPELFEKRCCESSCMKKVFKISDHIIAIDKNSYLKINKFFSGKVSFLPNPVKIQSYSYDLTSKKILFVGTLNKKKGVLELVEAFNHVSDKSLSLYLFGPHDCETEIIEMIKNNCNSDIHFMGQIDHDELINIYKNFSALILPSHTEGMPYCILEAMSFGIPVLASSVGEIPQMILDDSLLFKNISSSEIKEKIDEFFTDTEFRKKASINLYNRVKSNYSYDSIFKSMTKIWRDLYGK